MAPPEIDHTLYSQTRPQRADLTLERSNNYIIQPLLCRNSGSLHVADKQTAPGQGSAWEISVTLTSERRPGGEQRASIWMSGLREAPGKSRVLTHTAELHSPVLIGSRCSQMFSWWLPGKKTDTKTVRKTARRVGWGEEAGVCVCVCVCVCVVCVCVCVSVVCVVCVWCGREAGEER